jgi:anti-sigma B factor antagonist
MSESAPGADMPVLTMVGDVDIASEDEWRRRSEEFLEANPDLAEVVVDMAQVGFLDSRGMSVLVELHSRATARGGKLTLRAVPKRVFRALNVAGLDQVVQVEQA